MATTRKKRAGTLENETQALARWRAHLGNARIGSFTAGALSIGTGGTSKNRGSRSVDFNPQFESLLREMHARRTPDSSYIFPSPQRGKNDIRARSLRASLNMPRIKTGFPRAWLSRHATQFLLVRSDERDRFYDHRRMAWAQGLRNFDRQGLWHSLDAHRQKMAARLTIGIAPLAEVAK